MFDAVASECPRRVEAEVRSASLNAQLAQQLPVIGAPAHLVRAALRIVALHAIRTFLVLGLLTACGQGDTRPSDAGVAAHAAPELDAISPSDAGPRDAATGADAAVVDGGCTDLNVPGRRDHVLEVDGAPREVIVYVPESARSARAPVVFMLHGTSGDGEQFLNMSGWRQKADAEGFIAVFPSALTYCLREDENGDGDFDDRGERKVTTKWASGELGDPAVMPLCSAAEIARLPAAVRGLVDHPVHDDVAYIRAILDVLEAEYAVEPRRFYASGFSNGAQMTARLALEAGDRFAAIACAAGALSRPAAPAARPLSLFFSLGEVDPGPAALAGVPSFPLDETFVTDYPFVADAMAGFRTVLQLNDGFTFTDETIAGRRVAHFEYANSPTGAGNAFEIMVIEGLSHQYPNGRNHPVVMADVLWPFFQRHPQAE